MYTNYFKLAIITAAVTLSAIILILLFPSNSVKSELAATNARINSTASSVATTQTPILLKITYIKLSGKEVHIETYDNTIDIGNEVINEALIEFFLLHREYNLLHPPNSIPVRIAEKKDKASVIINLSESAVMFDIPLK